MTLTERRLATVKTEADAVRELQSARVQVVSAEKLQALGKLSQSTVDRRWREYFKAEDLAKSFGARA